MSPQWEEDQLERAGWWWPWERELGAWEVYNYRPPVRVHFQPICISEQQCSYWRMLKAGQFTSNRFIWDQSKAILPNNQHNNKPTWTQNKILSFK